MHVFQNVCHNPSPIREGENGSNNEKNKRNGVKYNVFYNIIQYYTIIANQNIK